MSRFLRLIHRSHWIAGGMAILVVVLGRRVFEWRSDEVWIVLALFGAWLLFCAIWGFLRRGATVDALIILDRRGGWKDRFSSAWDFLSRAERTEAELLHLRRASAQLSPALVSLSESLPLPRNRTAWILPLFALLLSLTSFARIAPEAGDLILTDEMLTTAEEQAAELRKSAETIQDLESLSEEEKEELESLRVQVEAAAETLADAEGLTAGEMLDALEARARAAERLAEKMGLDDSAWASEEMLAEMAAHPDTADLSLAIRDKAAEPAAMEAEALQEVLENPEISRSISDRFAETLEQIMAAALESDREKPVGERVGNASTKMLNQQPLTAAREFEELAKHFRFLLSREEARKKLEEMANSLREAGSEVSGSELEQMERIASENEAGKKTPEGLQALSEGGMPEDLQKMLAPQMTQSGAQQPNPGTPNSSGSGEDGEGGNMTPVPGEPADGNAEPGDGSGSLAMQAPVPGEPQEDSSGSGQSGAGSGESEAGSGEGGMLSAPVPGVDPGETGEDGSLAMSGGAGIQTGQGGNQAGVGTAAMVESESEQIDAARDVEVIAQVNEDGDSTVRAVEGQVRAEKATRSRQEIMTDFIAAEEQALDGKGIPLSRKEHVIRYFSEIRRQFEEGATSP